MSAIKGDVELHGGYRFQFDWLTAAPDKTREMLTHLRIIALPRLLQSGEVLSPSRHPRYHAVRVWDFRTRAEGKLATIRCKT